jgi:hypothetical protein
MSHPPVRQSMNRLLIILIVFLCTGFGHQKDPSPQLAVLTIIPDKDACNAPNAIFEQRYSDKKLILSFGYDRYFEKQDTINFLYKNDSLYIKVVKRNKPGIIFKDGIPDTLPGLRGDPDCECFTLFKLEIRELPEKPACIVVDKYVHDETLGFIGRNYISQIRSKIEAIEKSEKYRLDSIFIVGPELRSSPTIDDLAWYLKLRGTLSIEVLDADTEPEKELVARLQKLFIKLRMICPTRISEKLDKKMPDKDSLTVHVKISDTKSFLFADYNWKKR